MATADFSGLCSNLNTPVPIDIGIPIMMHSLTPEKGRNGGRTEEERRERKGEGRAKFIIGLIEM